jgi:hypothetical protein
MHIFRGIGTGIVGKKVTAYLRITGDMLMMYGVCGNMD